MSEENSDDKSMEKRPTTTINILLRNLFLSVPYIGCSCLCERTGIALYCDIISLLHIKPTDRTGVFGFCEMEAI